MLLVLFYGLSKGAREIVKKKAMETSSVMEVLLFYTLVSFVMVLPQAPFAGGLEAKYYFFIAIKSFVIFLAWMFSFKALKNMPVSLYGVLDLSRVLFATILALTVLSEEPTIYQAMGLIFVCFGLLSLKIRIPFLVKLFEDKNSESNAPKKPTNPVTPLIVILALASCMLNAVSGLLDKILMKDISSAQLQFWYMLFLISYYVIYVKVTKTVIRNSTLKNKWVWVLAVLFVLADKALFIANGSEASKVTIMTLIKQSGCIVTILGGKLVFKEKNVGYKLFCAGIIITGIVIAVLGK